MEQEIEYKNGILTVRLNPEGYIVLFFNGVNLKKNIKLEEMTLGEREAVFKSTVAYYKDQA